MSRTAKELIAFLKAMEFTHHHQAGGGAFRGRGSGRHRGRAHAWPMCCRPKPELPEAAKARRRPRPIALRAPINHDAYVTVTTAKELDDWVARAHARRASSASIPKPPRSIPCRRAFAACRWRWRRARPATFPAAIARATGFAGPSTARMAARSSQMAEADVLARLKPLLEDRSRPEGGPESEI